MWTGAFGVPYLPVTYGRCGVGVMRPNVDTLVVEPAAPQPGVFTRRGPLRFPARLGRSAAPGARVFWLLLTCVTTAMVPSTAWAEGKEASPKGYPPCLEKADDAAVAAARGAFEAGKAAFNEADYPRAILYWEDAFRRDCSAVLLLKNLARAYEAHGQHAEAAVALRTYLERAPEAEDKAELEAQLRDIDAKIAAATSPPPGPAPAARPSPSPSPASRANSSTEDASASEDGPDLTSDAETESPPNTTKVLAGVVAGTGAALAMVSAVFWFDANAQERKANEVCPERGACSSPEATRLGNEAIDSKQRWAIVGGVGGALVAGGIIWYLAAPSEAEDGGFTPELGPNYAGVTWTSGF